jgi:hypothetical protein
VRAYPDPPPKKNNSLRVALCAKKFQQKNRTYTKKFQQKKSHSARKNFSKKIAPRAKNFQQTAREIEGLYVGHFSKKKVRPEKKTIGKVCVKVLISRQTFKNGFLKAYSLGDKSKSLALMRKIKI